MGSIVVVGAGGWGRNLVRNFDELGACRAVADPSPAARAWVRENHPHLKIFQDHREALEAGCKALAFATPAHLHYEHAREALTAGADVFVEKPLTLRTEHARELAETADRQNSVFMVGHLLMYHPAIRWLKEYLDGNAGSRPQHISLQRAKFGRVRAHENVWWSFAPHDIAVALYLLDQPDIDRVTAQGHAILQPDIEDNVQVSLRFRSGQTAQLHSSWLWPQDQRSTTILTKTQLIRFDETSKQITVHNKHVDAALKLHDDGQRVVDYDEAEPLREECAHFLSCLETREKPLSDGWNGVAVVEILERAQEAMRAV